MFNLKFCPSPDKFYTNLVHVVCDILKLCVQWSYCTVVFKNCTSCKVCTLQVILYKFANCTSFSVCLLKYQVCTFTFCIVQCVQYVLGLLMMRSVHMYKVNCCTVYDTVCNCLLPASKEPVAELFLHLAQTTHHVSRVQTLHVFRCVSHLLQCKITRVTP